jgi:tetratricopeptide (TPR) repeat protein
MVAWRYAESLEICEQALALARRVHAREAEVRALTVLGGDLAYLGRGEEGLAHFRHAMRLAEEIGDHLGLERAYSNFTDALTMLGRPGESARVAEAGLEVMRRLGIDSALLVANRIEALLAIGDWDEADSASAAALRANASSWTHWLLVLRADSELGRGHFEAARAHLEAAKATLREDRMLGLYDAYVADLALWERRWTDADAAVQDGLAQARRREAAQIHVQLCAKGLRAQAELPALARARRDADTVRDRLGRAEQLLAVARRAAGEASAITPNAGAWLALAAAEYGRARGDEPPEAWSGPQTPGKVSNACLSPPTAACAKPRRSWPSAPLAPRRACRCARRTGSRPGSAQRLCCARSSGLRNERGSISRRRAPNPPRASRGCERCSG